MSERMTDDRRRELGRAYEKRKLSAREQLECLTEMAEQSAELAHLRAEAASASTRAEAAEQQLKAALEHIATMTPVWDRLVRIAQQQGRSIGGVLDDAEQHRKALARARNEGLEKAATRADDAAEKAEAAVAKERARSRPSQVVINETLVVEVAMSSLAERIRTMKDPES